MEPVAIGADPHTPEFVTRAQSLSAKLGLPLVRAVQEPGGLCLVVTADRLELREGNLPRTRPLYVDFLGGRMTHRRRSSGPSRSMLARAVGFRNKPLIVHDATAGLGSDAFLLATMGCTVTAIERSPVLAALLADGLERSSRDPELGSIIRARFHLVEGDARYHLVRLAESNPADVTYIDPMFPPKSKAALAKKEMRLCRRVAGDDADAAELFDIALATTRGRVVVKRWLHAPTLGGQPSMVYKGKTIRYDVYLCR